MYVNFRYRPLSIIRQYQSELLTAGLVIIATAMYDMSYRHQEDSVQYSRVGAVGVAALAVLARVVEALLDVVVARGSAEAGCARALVRVLQGDARRAVPTRHRRAVVLQLAVRPCNT